MIWMKIPWRIIGAIVKLPLLARWPTRGLGKGRRAGPGASSQRSGVSLVEIMVVASLAGLVFGGIMMMISHSRKTYQVGVELMDSQLVAEKIIQALVTDVKAMRTIVSLRDDELVLETDRGQGVERIRYQFDRSKRSVARVRTAGGGDSAHSQFDSEGMVEEFALRLVPGTTVEGIPWPPHLRLAMRIVPRDRRDVHVRLATISQFFAPALHSRPFGR